MKFWAIPSWSGDFRLEPSSDDDRATELSVFEPTEDELRIVNEIGQEAVRRSWLKSWNKLVGDSQRNESGLRSVFVLTAPLDEVGPVVSKIVKPGPAVLSAIRFADGRMTTASGSLADLEEVSREAAEDGTATAAATVKRPTPCCPNCIPGAIKPASEVLLAFLNESEHAEWAKDRSVMVVGGLSGHRYLLSHRHSPRAIANGRVCCDIDDGCVVHFHDWTVPPEEEVLSAKLILEHREPWLRNEATMFHRGNADMIFKNPFGDIQDGIADADFVRRIGQIAERLLG
jgi:hypothetical protein